MYNTLSKNTICNDDLHTLAVQSGAHIHYFYMPQAKALALKLADNCFIGLDYSVPENSARERIILAHELGHIQTDAFYGIRAPESVRKQAEQCAERWAVKKLVPKHDLKALLQQGLEQWEVAEYFNVTDEFIARACHLYFECGMQ